MAEALGCKMMLYTSGLSASATIFSYGSDRERVNMLFTSPWSRPRALAVNNRDPGSVTPHDRTGREQA